MKTLIRSLVVTFIFLCITPPFLHAEDIVSRIAVGRRPTDITFAPNCNRAYVNNFDDGTVSVIDPRSDQVVATIPVGKKPERPIAATNKRIFVPNAGRGGDEPGTVSVIDATVNRVIKEIPVGVDPSSGAATFVRCEVQPCVNDRVLVTNFSRGGPGTVSVIDVNTNQVIRTIAVGRGPFDIGIPNLGQKAFVANLNSRTVSVIDIPSFRVVSTIPVPGNPTAVFANTNSHLRTVYVSHKNSNGISAIDTERLEITGTMPTSYEPGRIASPAVGAINDILVPIRSSNRIDRFNFKQRTRIATIEAEGSRSVTINLAKVGKDTYVVGRDSVLVFDLGLASGEETARQPIFIPPLRAVETAPRPADTPAERLPPPEPQAACTIQGEVTGRPELVRRMGLYKLPRNQQIQEVGLDSNGRYRFQTVGDGEYAVVPIGSGGHKVLVSTPTHINISCRGRQSHSANFHITGEEMSWD